MLATKDTSDQFVEVVVDDVVVRGSARVPQVETVSEQRLCVKSTTHSHLALPAAMRSLRRVITETGGT